MKIYDDLTPALQGILRSWATGDTHCWIAFRTEADKLDALRDKFIEAYGTKLGPEKRRWRRSQGLPTSWAAAAPVLGHPNAREIILLASREALDMTLGPFSREKWIQTPPEFSDFVITKEPRPRGDYSWTWRINRRTDHLIDEHLKQVVLAGRSRDVAAYTHKLIRFYPMFGGIRRQLARKLKGAKKLWIAHGHAEWPGPNPVQLPAMVGFRPEKVE